MYLLVASYAPVRGPVVVNPPLPNTWQMTTFLLYIVIVGWLFRKWLEGLTAHVVATKAEGEGGVWIKYYTSILVRCCC